MIGKTVLVIEDEFLVALEIQTELTNAGFAAVEHAATEQEALARIQEGQWDAVVADANLNGRGLTRIASALNQHGIPFVVVTGYSRESLPPEVREVPVIDKPFSGRKLVQTVRNLCRESRSGEPDTQEMQPTSASSKESP
jgi:DNA-binding response OmpR family regulator